MNKDLKLDDLYNKFIKKIIITDVMDVSGCSDIIFFSNWSYQDRSCIRFEIDSNEMVEIQHFCIESELGDCFYFVEKSASISKYNENLDTLVVNHYILNITVYGSSIPTEVKDMITDNYSKAVHGILLNLSDNLNILFHFDSFLHNGEIILSNSEIEKKLQLKIFNDSNIIYKIKKNKKQNNL